MSKWDTKSIRRELRNRELEETERGDKEWRTAVLDAKVASFD
jgi:hypothetical protein